MTQSVLQPPSTEPSGALTPPAKRPRSRESRDRQQTMLLLLPALVPVFVLSVIPLARGLYLGFTDAKLGLNVETNFIGIDNFTNLADNDLFWNSFRIGAVWAISVTVLQFVAAFGLALLLNQPLRFRGFMRTMALIPWAMPPVVVAIMWRLLLDPVAGPVNEFFRFLGVTDRDIDWLGDFGTALPAAIVVGVWVGMPQTTVTLLAGLQSIDTSIHEAAEVDGAGTIRRLFSITLPQLRPVIMAITSLDIIWNFNSFGLIYVLTAGGPGGETMLPMLFAYNEAFRYGRFGSAAAMGDVMLVIIVVVLFFYLRGRLRERES